MSGNDFPNESNVLSLSANTKTTQTLDQFETYWNKVRGNRLVPSRCEIDPRGLEGMLSHAFILERITGGLARFRIAGQHLTELTDLELRQMPISALFLPTSREVLSEALKAAFDDPAIIRMSITSPASFGRAQLNGEMILLPLRSDLGDIDRVLGGLVMTGKIGRTPRRIDIVSQSRRSLTGYAGPKHAARTPLPVSTPPRTSVTERVTRRLNGSAEKPISEKGHLKLVVCND